MIQLQVMFRCIVCDNSIDASVISVEWLQAHNHKEKEVEAKPSA